jgi:lipoic acid synthetase
MLGLGESEVEVLDVMERLVGVRVDLFTIGQYLQPSKYALPVVRFVPPSEFEALGKTARTLGFKGVSSGPLVRSSYLAEEQAAREIF